MPTMPDHAQRIYDYISRLWFMPATPVLSNGGTGRGLPISCYLNSGRTTASTASSAPGTRTSGWPPRRRHRHLLGQCARHRRAGRPERQDLGIIPFVRVMDSLTLAISQGSLRRGSAACYLDIATRRSRSSSKSASPRATSTARPEPAPRRAQLTDAFMEAVRDGAEFGLRSPKDGSCKARSMRARCSRSWSRRASPPASPISSSPTP
jgi:ribonucleoside-diphosphate reductase alpha chain